MKKAARGFITAMAVFFLFLIPFQVASAAPRLKYLSSVYTNAAILDNNRISYYGKYTPYDAYTVQLKVALQKTRTPSVESSWVNAQTTTQTFAAKGTQIIDKAYSNLTSGWYYRCQTTATVLINGLPDEIVVVTSRTLYFS